MASNKSKLETPEYRARLFAFSERLKKERKKLDIKQSELAKRAGLSGHAVISRWEAVADPDRGGDFTSPGAVARELPDVNDILKLCTVFGCEIDYLVGIQELPTKAATDISDKIGLSEMVIKELSDMPTSDRPIGRDHAIAIGRQAETLAYRKMINLMLSETQGKRALKMLFYYFFARIDRTDQLPSFSIPWIMEDGCTFIHAADIEDENLYRQLFLNLAEKELHNLNVEHSKQEN